MANVCDNSLTIYSKTPITYLKKEEEGYSIEGEKRFLFINHETGPDYITSAIDMSKVWFYQLEFETKWAPPIEFYEMMEADDNIISFEGKFFEPGCELIGSFTKKEGMYYEDFPKNYYSASSCRYVLLEEPSALYSEMAGDDYVLIQDYLGDCLMEDRNEAIECIDSLYFNVN